LIIFINSKITLITNILNLIDFKVLIQVENFETDFFQVKNFAIRDIKKYLKRKF